MIVKNFKIHRLVAQSFIPNPENKLEVNHINEIKNDNRFFNLNWMTSLENNNHGTRNFRLANSNNIEIDQYSLNGVYFIKRFKSITEAASFTNTDGGSISKALRGLLPHANFYTWKCVK